MHLSHVDASVPCGCMYEREGAVLQVLSNVASRLAVMHEAGYVHRDLKPANVMWLPRENRWIVIDFGCVARIGDVVPLSFSLAYASPEVVRAHKVGIARMEAWPALDAWSLGVMAFELLTGAPAFKFLTEGRAKVCSPHFVVTLCGVALCPCFSETPRGRFLHKWNHVCAKPRASVSEELLRLFHL